MHFSKTKKSSYFVLFASLAIFSGAILLLADLINDALSEAVKPVPGWLAVSSQISLCVLVSLAGIGWALLIDWIARPKPFWLVYAFAREAGLLIVGRSLVTVDGTGHLFANNGVSLEQRAIREAVRQRLHWDSKFIFMDDPQIWVVYAIKESFQSSVDYSVGVMELARSHEVPFLYPGRDGLNKFLAAAYSGYLQELDGNTRFLPLYAEVVPYLSDTQAEEINRRILEPDVLAWLRARVGLSPKEVELDKCDPDLPNNNA